VCWEGKEEVNEGGGGGDDRARIRCGFVGLRPRCLGIWK
jgi:hypothetical protein